MKKEVKEYLENKLNTVSILVEVGAHYGEDTVRFLSRLSPDHIHCFEPDPRNISIFKKYVHDPRITLHEVAASSEDKKQVDFYPSYQADFDSKMFKKYHWIDREEYVDMKLNSSGSSSLKENKSIETLNPIKVETVRLDTWAKKNDITKIDFLWIDVQGAEKDVISGLGDLSKAISCIWIEYGERRYRDSMDRQQTIDLITSLRFALDRNYSDVGSNGDLLFWKKR